MPAFIQIWNNHPNIKGEDALLDKEIYQNQCAVNLYVALQRSGVNVRTFNGQLSWQKNTPKYALRAQELANWLASPVSKIEKVEKYSGRQIFDKIRGRTGIIFFQNYWGVGMQGDHIDLWNGTRLTHWISWVQIYARIGSVGINSDYRGAESVWFWRVP